MPPAYGATPPPWSALRADTATSGADALPTWLAAASRDPDRVRLEGFHATKHAVRFGADLEVVLTPDLAAVGRLLADLAPDVVLPADRTLQVPAALWDRLVARPLPSPLLAVARRPEVTAGTVLAAPGRVVALDRPRHLGNLGAVIRVAAAAGAGGVLVVAPDQPHGAAPDPWHPTVVRAAAGLHWAIRVARTDHLPATARPVVALDPDGDDLVPGALPDDAVLLVGTERGGLTPGMLAAAGGRVRLPMRPGVSSLNLATAVAAALYAAGPG